MIAKADDNSTPLLPVESLFKRAFDNRKAEFIFTLVRVDGMYFGRKDAFTHAEELLGDLKPDFALDKIPAAQVLGGLDACKTLFGTREILDFLFNLIACLKGQQYTLSPFAHLASGRFSNYVPPALLDVLRALHSEAAEVDEPLLTDLTATLLTPELLSVLKANTFLIEDSTVIAQGETRIPVDTVALTNALARCIVFYRELIETGRVRRMRLNTPRRPRRPRPLARNLWSHVTWRASDSLPSSFDPS